MTRNCRQLQRHLRKMQTFPSHAPFLSSTDQPTTPQALGIPRSPLAPQHPVPTLHHQRGQLLDPFGVCEQLLIIGPPDCPALKLGGEEAGVVPIRNLQDMQGLGMHQDAVGVRAAVTEEVFLLAGFDVGLLGWSVGLAVVIHDPQGRDHHTIQACGVGPKRVELRGVSRPGCTGWRWPRRCAHTLHILHRCASCRAASGTWRRRRQARCRRVYTQSRARLYRRGFRQSR